MKRMKPYEEMKDAILDSDIYRGENFKDLKDFLDYYMIIPKCNIKNMSEEEKKIIQKYRVYFTSDNEPKSQMFFQKKVKQKKFTLDEVNTIKKEHFVDGLSYRKLSYKYNCSTRTIYSILKDKY